MSSAIDATKPVAGTPTTASVRDNFAAAKSEIEALQTTVAALPATYQPLDGTLTALAALITAANKLIYATGADTFALTDLSAFARTILDDADALAVRTTIGAQASDAELTALAGLTSAADKVPYFTGSGTAAVADFTSFGRTLAALANAAAGRTALGLAIGTDVQAFHANLSQLAGLSLVADRLPYANGTGTLALATLTAAGRALLDDADAAAQLATLGVIVPYFFATRLASQTLTADAYTKVQLNSEVLDSAGAYDPTTNFRWTPQTAGYYAVFAGGAPNATSGEPAGIAIYKNGTVYDFGQSVHQPGASSNVISTIATFVQLNGSSDYIELFGYASNNGTPTIVNSFMGGFRLA